MKKILLAACAVGLMCLTGCKKDNSEPTPGDSTPDTRPEEVRGDGVYNPERKINTIVYYGDEAPQVWIWDGQDLLSTNVSDNCGGYRELSVFTYNNHRLLMMETTLQNMPVEVGYVYNGDKLTDVSVYSGGLEVVDVMVEHNPSDKISHLSLDVDETMLGLLNQFFGNGFGGFFKRAPMSKFTAENLEVDVDLLWQGDNVSQMVANASFEGDITLGEIRQLVNLDSMMGGYGALLAFLSDSTVLPLTLSLHDTSHYTYDSHPNPFYGYLGELEATHLSACNVTEVVTSGTAVVTITLQTMLGNMDLPFSYPLPSRNMSYSYTYEESGFPSTVTDSEGSETHYLYQ